MTYEKKSNSLTIEPKLSARLPLKAIEINGVDTTCFFLENIVVLIYLLIIVGFLKSYSVIQEASHCFKKLIEKRNLLKNSPFNGFDAFLSEFLLTLLFLTVFY